MKNLVKIFALIFGLTLAVSAQSQVLREKMPIGIKSYTVQYSALDTLSGKMVEYDLEFYDFKGVFDQYDFDRLDTSIKAVEKVLVYDPKIYSFRLPLSHNEAFGVSERKRPPLVRVWITLGEVAETHRQKIR